MGRLSVGDKVKVDGQEGSIIELTDDGSTNVLVEVNGHRSYVIEARCEGCGGSKAGKDTPKVSASPTTMSDPDTSAKKKKKS